MSRSHDTGLQVDKRIVFRQSALMLGTTAVGATASAQLIRYSEPVVYTEMGRASYLVSADLDRDAHEDVIVTGGGAVTVYFNDGTGRLRAGTSIPYERSLDHFGASDLDGDLHVDLTWLEGIEGGTYVYTVWFNSGDGRSGEIVRTPVERFSSLSAQLWDITGDGLDDIVYSAGPRTVDALINQGDRAFEPIRLFTHPSPDYSLEAFVPGDFDDDGDVDILATYQDIYSYRYKAVYDSQVVLLINNRTAPFRQGPHVTLPWRADDIIAYSMLAGDLDGDGDVDAMVAGNPGNDPGPNVFVMLENHGDQLSIAETYRATEGWPEATTLADVNTDGRLDVMFATSSLRGVYALRNRGEFVFEGVSPFPTSILGSALDIADLNGDGQFDIIHGGLPGIAVLFNETSLPGPRLEVSRLVRGQPATFVVRNARAGESVQFIYSLNGIGRTRGRDELGGVTLDLRFPLIHFATALADSNGVAVLRRRIPADARLGPISLQAAIRRGPGGGNSVKTPFQTVLVEE